MATLHSALAEGRALGMGARVLGAPPLLPRRDLRKKLAVRKSDKPAAPIPEGTRCDCRKADATVQVWFRQFSAGHVANGDTVYQDEIIGTLMLCPACYADMLALDPDLSLAPLEKVYV